MLIRNTPTPTGGGRRQRKDGVKKSTIYIIGGTTVTSRWSSKSPASLALSL